MVQRNGPVFNTRGGGGGGGSGRLSGRSGEMVPLRPSNANPVEDKIFSPSVATVFKARHLITVFRGIYPVQGFLNRSSILLFSGTFLLSQIKGSITPLLIEYTVS